MPTGGVKALRKVQIGVEATKGTAVPATHILLADCDVDLSGYELYRNTHPAGVLTEHLGPTALLKKDVDLKLSAEAISYQQLAWWLSLSLDQPATTGAGPYVHTFDPGVAALWNPHSATVELHYEDGTNDEDVEFEYVTAKTLRISGTQNGAVTAEIDCFARKVTDAAVTSLTIPTTLNPILVAQAKYYINDTWALAFVAAPAAGIVSNQIISFNLEVDVGQFPWHGVEGATTFAEAKERQKNARLTVRSLYNPDAATEGAAAERVHAAAGDLRFPTISFTGPGNMKLHIAMSGKHENGEFLVQGDEDGLDVTEMTFVGHYDPTGAKLIAAVLTNDTVTALG